MLIVISFDNCRHMEAHEPAHVAMALIASAIGECSDDPAKMRRLARAFAARIRKVWITSACACKENF